MPDRGEHIEVQSQAHLISVKEVFKQKHYPILTQNSKRYQYLLVAYLSALWIIANYITMTSSFVYQNPVFECKGEPATELQACQMMSECKILNNFTATYHNKLFCDK